MDALSKTILLEAKQLDNPDVSYEYTGSSKAKTANGEFNKVTVFLKGHDSRAATIINRDAEHLKKLKAEVEKYSLEANNRAKEKVDLYFDAVDAAYTRVIETVSTIATFSKQTPETEVEVTSIDYEGAIKELLELASEDLSKTINTILDQRTKIIKKVKPETTMKLTSVKDKKLGEGIGDTIDTLVDRLSAWVSRRLNNYDKKVEKILQKYNLS